MRSLLSGLMAPPLPTRVALLNTGELVLLDHMGRAQVLSVQTTELIRTALNAATGCTVHDLVGGQP